MEGRTRYPIPLIEAYRRQSSIDFVTQKKLLKQEIVGTQLQLEGRMTVK